MPEKNFLCCEVHPPGVGALLKRIGDRACQHPHRPTRRRGGPGNHHGCPPECPVSGVHIFFSRDSRGTRPATNKRAAGGSRTSLRQAAGRGCSRGAASIPSARTDWGAVRAARLLEVLAAVTPACVRNAAVGFRAVRPGLPAAHQVREPRLAALGHRRSGTLVFQKEYVTWLRPPACGGRPG
jgi:hypothetical protein